MAKFTMRREWRAQALLVPPAPLHDNHPFKKPRHEPLSRHNACRFVLATDRAHLPRPPRMPWFETGDLIAPLMFVRGRPLYRLGNIVALLPASCRISASSRGSVCAFC
ncbi:protein of unknown function [Burkholderia multivorans]